MNGLYRLGIRLFEFGTQVAARRKPKIRKFVDGRKDYLSGLKKARSKSEKVIWMHCASLGEFEQGRPVVEKFKEQHPEFDIYITFFSPSGYEVRKNYKHAAWVGYLPLDRAKYVSPFLGAMRPNVALVVKYEVWPVMFEAIKQRNIPLVLFSAIFRPEHRYFKWYGGVFRDALRCVSAFYVQNDESVDLLKGIGLNNATLSGDTRFDRVAQIAAKSKGVPMMTEFAQDSLVVVAGSTWLPDEKLLASYDHQSEERAYKLVIAPHEIKESHLDQIEALWPNGILRYSKATPQLMAEARVLLIDNVGLLSRLYGYADFAIIGGGFGAGIHNTLEAAAFGLPVIIGPNYTRFQEAVDLQRIGGAIVVKNQKEFSQAFAKLLKVSEREQLQTVIRQYCDRQRGATDQIVAGVERLLEQ